MSSLRFDGHRPALALRNVHVRPGNATRDALRDLSLEVRAGEILALVGPNGSGKSTALAALARVLPPRQGRVELAGEDAHRVPQREFARYVARLPQHPSCPEGLRVIDLVLAGRYAHRRPLEPFSPDDLSAARDALQAVDLLDLRHRAMDSLSGGEARRAWLAMVLCQRAPILLLDEPTAALDLRHQRELLELLRILRAQRGVTLVVVLHDLEHAAWLADRVAVLHRGRLFAAGAPARVFGPDTLRDVFGVAAEIRGHGNRLAIRVSGAIPPVRVL